jgi:hypothetical protein
MVSPRKYSIWVKYENYFCKTVILFRTLLMFFVVGLAPWSVFRSRISMLAIWVFEIISFCISDLDKMMYILPCMYISPCFREPSTSTQGSPWLGWCSFCGSCRKRRAKAWRTWRLSSPGVGTYESPFLTKKIPLFLSLVRCVTIYRIKLPILQFTIYNFTIYIQTIFK